MEEKNKQQEPQPVKPSVGCGSLLASARKEQKKSVEEIADELNLSVTQIKTIELDQSEGLPEPTYVRGYIRSYAKLLGLDAEKILESYLHPNWQKSSSLDDIPRRIGNADEESKRFFTPVKVIVFLVLIGSLTFLWMSGLLVTKQDPTPQDLIDNASELESNDTQNAKQIEAAQTVSSSVQSGQVSDDGLIDESVSELTESSSVDIDETVEPALVNNDLVLTFSQTCWVDVRDSDDNRLAYKSYAAGEELIITNEAKLHVFLGNAEGVNATYQGEPFDISSYREGVYAKFSLVKK